MKQLHTMNCWRKNGCLFNSNNSVRFMKCLQEEYSVNQCKKDNIARINSLKRKTEKK